MAPTITCVPATVQTASTTGYFTTSDRTSWTCKYITIKRDDRNSRGWIIGTENSLWNFRIFFKMMRSSWQNDMLMTGLVYICKILESHSRTNHNLLFFCSYSPHCSYQPRFTVWYNYIMNNKIIWFVIIVVIRSRINIYKTFMYEVPCAKSCATWILCDLSGVVCLLLKVAELRNLYKYHFFMSRNTHAAISGQGSTCRLYKCVSWCACVSNDQRSNTIILLIYKKLN